ncbi:family 4 glycosyltransferase [Melampsora larici-populina 98AG31]|uniref:GDP-Man:Man(3)GlcNAc(2)-PP-Dol alpha-1,2-mannosyltransferase n=1 Tax=Melampsora larici-populina (strain 98AG31 / pathotype 3-4-7) TaxID=747676 RepID=F4RJU7_MELLP|nr:family 4 glycosyltransferase [Melampsora larici-populina 98AG31]EGG07436.1 family 4 glycosyltransferase [Melampsora larici-populina 98AG31]
MKLQEYSIQLFTRSPPLIKLTIILTFLTQSIYIVYLMWKVFIKVLRQRLFSSNQLKRNQLINQTINQSSSTLQTFREKRVIGLFHPYCNAGGGGERVLWTAVSFHQRSDPNTICAIYTGDLNVTKSEMINKVKQRFDIDLDPYALILIPLKTRYLVESSRWPRFTLVGQSLGSMVLAYEAITQLIPDIYIDTMGYAFTFLVWSALTSIPIGAYVHYPTISTNMLKRVTDRNSSYQNSTSISSSFVLSYLKVLYYLLFAEVYSVCLKRADYLMVNSTWTKTHVDKLLRAHFHHSHSSTPPRSSQIVYPPCDVKTFTSFPLLNRKKLILSISQYRPEKDQLKQIESFAKFSSSSNFSKDVKMILVGSCRNQEDLDRVESLRNRCKELGIQSSVELRVNVGWDELKELLGSSLVGISTMVDEHFGISIVEFMAAGLVPLVHKSGGPLMDIINETGNRTGFFGTDVDSFAARLEEIFRLSETDCLKIRSEARRVSVEKFSVKVFESAWENGVGEVMRVGMDRIGKKEKKSE